MAVEPLDDEVPLPVAQVFRATPQGDVLEQPASGDPYYLGFAGRLHYPPAGERVDAELYDNARTVYPDGRPSAETYAFVMFSKRMTGPRLKQLEALGCRLLGFHPHYTQKVAIPAGSIDAVAALPFVRWVGVPKQDQKLHPALVSELAKAQPNQPLDLWVSVYESDVGPASVRKTIPGGVRSGPNIEAVPGDPIELPHVWITNGWQQHALEAAGLEVVDFAERASAFRVRALPQALELVTALDFVQFVELDPPARLAHDESMPMVNADDARSFYDGGTNLQAIAGMVDSGMAVGHQDFSPLWLYSSNLPGAGSGIYDLCGHGTHVAGTILGRGQANDDHTGVAPGLGWGDFGEFYNARVFADCTPQPVDVAAVLGFMTTPLSFTPRPHVINNSWGTDGNSASPWVGTESDCQLYDSNAYFNAQLNVFAAGDEGSASSTIRLQAAAKNVLTVGSVRDYDHPSGGPGTLQDSSSRGPTGDNRWKPNVVAPGSAVTSADAFDPSGYVVMSGTSMAAPHATGIAAQLIDSDINFAYLPERITAQLMATSHTKDNQLLSTPSVLHHDEYGAGRVDATRAIGSGGGIHSSWAFSLSAGSSTFADFAVPAGATRLVAVMHYVEPAASSGASKALINDWDFYLDQPPIDPAGNTGEWFIQQSALDNTEIRTIANPIEGWWRWKIWPDSTSTTAYFGVSVYVQLLDDTPAISPTVSKSATHAKPLEVVDVDYYLPTSGGSISGVFLDGTANTGASLSSVQTFLADGVVTELSDNQQSGWGVALGNVEPYFMRHARWSLYWTTEGNKSFCIQADSDNASNAPVTSCENIVVDGTPPGLVGGLVSTSHTPGVWSNDDTIDFVWTPAVDPVSGGVASGLDGYSYLFSFGAPGVPSPLTALGPGATSLTSPPLSSAALHYFNIRGVDLTGNWGATASLGPYFIDTVPPTPVSGLSSSSHALGTTSCNGTISLSWTAAADAHSAIAGYGVLVDNSPTTPAVPTVTTTATSTTATVGVGTWYAHVRAVDLAGNAGGSTHLGPFVIDPLPVSLYCAAKINSQGCTPKIGVLNAPSFSGGAFEVIASNVLNNKSGLLFWGTNSSLTPFQGGTKCVANPVRRTPIQNSGGSPPPDDCSGAYSFNFSRSYLSSKGVTVGDTLYAQYWTRDPAAPFSTGLTDAVKFTICQ